MSAPKLESSKNPQEITEERTEEGRGVGVMWVNALSGFVRAFMNKTNQRAMDVFRELAVKMNKEELSGLTYAEVLGGLNKDTECVIMHILSSVLCIFVTVGACLCFAFIVTDCTKRVTSMCQRIILTCMTQRISSSWNWRTISSSSQTPLLVGEGW